MKEETKRKIFFALAAMVFLLGVVGVLRRKDPIEKNIGNVYVYDGAKETALKGFKLQINRNGSISEYDCPDIKSQLNNIYTINASSENSNMKISYSKECYGNPLYNIYDSDFNLLSSDQSSLNIPADVGKTFFVSASVLWGTENEYVNMIYYFSIIT